MKKLTITLILLLSLAVARAQEVVDYGIEIVVNMYPNDYHIRVTENNKDAVLRDFLDYLEDNYSYMSFSEEEKSKNITYNPITNTLSAIDFVYAELYDIRVEPKCPKLTIELNSKQPYPQHIQLISGEQSDITFSSLNVDRSIDLENCYISAYSVTLSEGTRLEDGNESARIITQHLIIEKDAALHIGSWSPSVIESLTVNAGTLSIKNYEEGNAVEGGIAHVEMNGSHLDEESNGYDFDAENCCITGEGSRLVIKPDVEQVAIEDISATSPKVSNTWFTIQGQRIAEPSTPGVYIHNGKKKLK